MSATRDFDDIARAWLDLMPDEAPDRAVDSVLQAIETTPQRRPWLGGPWRLSKMTRIAIVAGVAAIAVASGAFLLLGRPTTNVGPQPSTPPSIAPGDSRSGGALDDALRATWLANAGADPVLQNGSGPVSLTVSSVGTSMEAANFGAGYGYASTATQIGPEQIEVVLDRTGGDCVEGARGLYGARLSDSGSFLTLTTLSDDCTKRGRVFDGMWLRSLAAATTVGAGVIDTMDPDFSVTLPDDTYEARTLDDFFEIGGSNGNSLMVFKNPQPFVDACSTEEERVPYQPGAAAFVEAFRNNDAFDVSEATPITVDGNPGLHVTIGGKANYARCPGQELYEYTPKDCLCHFVVGQGFADSMYLVEVGSDTFMFIISPLGSVESEQPIIDSIRIPVELPTQ